MKLTEAYVIYNNSLHSMDVQLAEAIDRIIDDKNIQIDQLNRVELAEAKARMQAEEMAKVAMDDTYNAFLEQREIKRLREVLAFYADEKNYVEEHKDPFGADRWDSAVTIDEGERARKVLAGEST